MPPKLSTPQRVLSALRRVERRRVARLDMIAAKRQVDNAKLGAVASEVECSAMEIAHQDPGAPLAITNDDDGAALSEGGGNVMEAEGCNEVVEDDQASEEDISGSAESDTAKDMQDDLICEFWDLYEALKKSRAEVVDLRQAKEEAEERATEQARVADFHQKEYEAIRAMTDDITRCSWKNQQENDALREELAQLRISRAPGNNTKP